MANPPDGFLSLTNFERYQQYRDGRPLHWVKLYLSILDDYTFCALPDVVKWQFVGLMLLAGKYDNKIPADKAFLASKLSCKSLDLDTLLSAGLISYESVLNRTEPSDDPVLRVEKSRVEKTLPLDGFDLFWKSYPRKKEKAEAMKSWRRISPKNGLVERILAAVEAAKLSGDWLRQNGKYIPYPVRWLNKGCWDDEPTGPQPTNGKVMPDEPVFYG